jgi:diguanylate cyclase (GGDEF)-like protein
MFSKKIWYISLMMWFILIGFGLVRWQGSYLVKKQGGTVVGDDLKIYDASSNEFITYRNSTYPGTLAKETYHFELFIEAYEEEQILEIAKPQLASVYIIQTTQNGEILKEVKLGRNYDYEDQKIQYKNLVATLNATNQPSKLTFYVQTNTYLQMPLIFWDRDEFVNYVFVEQILTGLFYGMIIVMVLYNLMLGAFLREKHYCYYVALLISYLLLQMVWDGTAYQYLWPNLNELDRIANPFLINASSTFMVAFTSQFLRTNEKSRILSKVYKAIIFYVIIVSFIVLLIPSNKVLYLAMLSSTLAVVYTTCSLFALKFSRRSEGIFLVALELFFIGNVLNILSGIGFMPYTVYTMMAPKVGTIFMIILFSLALVDRIREMELLKGIESNKANLLKEIHELNKKIVASRDIKRVAKHVIHKYTNLSGQKEGILILLDQNTTSDVTCYLADGTSQSLPLTNLELTELVDKIKNNNLQCIETTEMPYLSMNHSENLILVPLNNFEILIGVLVLSGEKATNLNAQHMEILKDYATQITIIIGNIQAFDETYNYSRMDDLTKVYNRRGIFEILHNYCHPSYAELPLSFLMIDIDHFKKVNDTFGHSIGDEVLKMVTKDIRTMVEDIGEIGRYGGEEFIVLLPNTQLDKAKELAEQLRSSISQLTYIVDNKTKIQITISIGISSRDNQDESVYELCDRADQGLYEAKKSGRNQVCVQHYVCKDNL